MPQDKDFKRIVRQRMAETGELYTTARAALEGSPIAGGAIDHVPPPTPPSETEEKRTPRDSMDGLLELAVLGVRAEHVRDYRRAAPGISLGDIEELWTHGIRPDTAAFRDWLQLAEQHGSLGLTSAQMAEAAAHGLTPDELADFARLLEEQDDA